MNGYLMMRDLKALIEKCEQIQHPLALFQRVTQVVKCFCQNKGIYSYKMGYLNGIAIMIMVAYVITKVQHKLKGLSLEVMTQNTIYEFFKRFGEWDWGNREV